MVFVDADCKVVPNRITWKSDDLYVASSYIWAQAHKPLHVFKELISASELPFFISSNHLTRSHRPDDRIYVPIDDEEMHVTYYCICKNIHKKMLDRIEVE